MAIRSRRGLTKIKEEPTGLKVIIPEEIKEGYVYIVDVKINDLITKRTSYSVIYHDEMIKHLEDKFGKKYLNSVEIFRIISKSKQNF